MKARQVDVYINKTKVHSFERSEGNEITEVAIRIDNKIMGILR